MPESNLEIRTAARLVLLDATGRVLLFHYSDGHGQAFWATPGGGLEPGETLEQAARREAAEELGIECVGLRRLWDGHTSFRFADRDVSQTETFFAVETPSTLFGQQVERAHQAEAILAFRWWSVDEIEISTERIYPIDLAQRICRMA